jgi:hypothetical protein
MTTSQRVPAQDRPCRARQMAVRISNAVAGPWLFSLFGPFQEQRRGEDG